MVAKIIVVLFTLVAVCSATNPKGILYPFPIESLLECHIANPFANIRGQPLTRVEAPPRIPFGAPLIVNDGFFSGPLETTLPYELWRPQSSGFRMPANKIPHESLIKFLGGYFNSELTSIEQPGPNKLPLRACDLLPAIEGSAAQQMIHIEEVDEVLSLLEEFGDGTPSSLVFNQTTADRLLSTRLDVISEDFASPDFMAVLQVIQETNDREPLCDIWLGKCPLRTRWVDIGESYFPRYLAQSVCSGKDCSLPRGLTCQEDFSYAVYVTVLRWDCCYNQLNRETRWDCGWRRVQVPIFCDCTCGCSEVLSHAGN